VETLYSVNSKIYSQEKKPAVLAPQGLARTCEVCKNLNINQSRNIFDQFFTFISHTPELLIIPDYDISIIIGGWQIGNHSRHKFSS